MSSVPDVESLPAFPAPEVRARRAGPKRLALLALVALTVAAGARWATASAPKASFRTAEVVRGDVRETVTATGTLEAVTTVEIGTQVSGVIQELLVDYNDEVVAGQVIARIDPTLLEADVLSAEATLAQRRAEARRAAADLARTRRLHDADAATPMELETAEAAAVTAGAQARAAEVALERARRNRDYAVITSPIDGTVLVRDVEVGQTVNAGMSAPRLYLVAGDLSRMRILVDVDEADIGRLAPGQPVRFTVQAWPDRSFEGTVDEVRLQSVVTENVVTYTVVVDVENPDGKLLPGMTATVDFVVAEVRDTLLVPNAALRFGPEGLKPAARGGWGTLWVQAEGGLRDIPVAVGLTDGRSTAVEGEGLVEGMHVVTGAASTGSGREGTTNPFQPTSSRRGGRPPGGF